MTAWTDDALSPLYTALTLVRNTVAKGEEANRTLHEHAQRLRSRIEDLEDENASLRAFFDALVHTDPDGNVCCRVCGRWTTLPSDLQTPENKGHSDGCPVIGLVEAVLYYEDPEKEQQ
jgi:hypothetical protein